MKRCVAVLAVFAWTIADLGAQPGRPEIAFTPDGSVGALREGAGWTNQVRSSNPGRGFLLRTFTGSAIEEIRLDKVQFEGEALRVGRDDRPPRLLFKVHRGLRYLGFRLERVEGVPASSQTSLAFEMNGVDSGLRVLALDYMTRASSVDGAVRVEFNHLWHRRAGDPLGGFALYVASTDEAEDDALAEIWSQEDLPRPVVAEPWTPDRVRRWVDDYHERFKDMTTMILAAGSSAELYQLTAVAERRGVRIVYLHTDTWRGEYWPAKNSHVHVNPQVFPEGRRDLRRYSDHLASRGMHLALHYVCAGIVPEDPRRIQGRVSRDLATWGHGELAESVDARARTLRFRPAPGTEYPLASSPASNAPGVYERIWDTGFVRLGEEIVRVGRWIDVDGPVWTLGDC
ncbi:MAG: hypothetical protein JNL97_00280, partial [Verrucomicrobiales bacterium]|nr:hypothetical protein [Verrucomicrobiales bacterium]